MTARASRMRTVTIANEHWVSVADVVTLLRDMATSVKDGPGSQNLLKVAEALAPLLGPKELLPASDTDLQLGACPACGEPAYTLDRHGSDLRITLAAKPAAYGRWMIVSPFDRPPLAVEFDRRRPGSHELARYREHRCPRQAAVS